MKAYMTWIKGEEGRTSGIYAAESAGKARYMAYLVCREVGFEYGLTEFRARRAPQFDVILPELRGRKTGYALDFAVERLAAAPAV